MTMVSKTFAEVLTFTRASTGTYFDSSGVLQTAAVDEARFDHDPDTNDPLGILIEESRTNLFLNSDSPATQNITVTSGATYTVSVIGTGSADLTDSGTGSATEGSPVTFTASTTTLTVTITGSVDYCQVEEGAFATSIIITAGSPATRAADNLKRTLSDEYENDSGTLLLEYSRLSIVDSWNAIGLYGSSTNVERIGVSGSSGDVNELFAVIDSSSFSRTISGLSAKVAISWTQGGQGVAAINGVSGVIDSSVSTIQMSRLDFNKLANGTTQPGLRVASARYYPRAMAADELEALTS